MNERDGQLAIDFVLEVLKTNHSIINLSNYLYGRDRIFEGKYKNIDERAIVEAWTNFFLDGWIGPDPGQSSGELIRGWLRLTSYGKSQLKAIGEDYYPVFLDPAVTIRSLQSTIPNIDDIALKYFEESLWAIRKHLFLSAIVTMGCASERSILLLTEAIMDYYDDPKLREEFYKNDKIKPKFDLIKRILGQRAFKKELTKIFESDVPRSNDLKRLFIDLDNILDQMFQIYRINRNDAGHPSGIEFDQDITRAEAAMFRKYCKIIYGLISYLNEAASLKRTS